MEAKLWRGGGGAESAPQVKNVLNRPGEIGLIVNFIISITVHLPLGGLPLRCDFSMYNNYE